MSRLAIRCTSPLLLLSLMGSAASSEPAAPASNTAPPPPVTQKADATPAATEKAPAEAAQAGPATATEASSGPAVPPPGTEPPPPLPPLVRVPLRTQFSGFVDVYHEYNFNRPAGVLSDGTRNDTQNELRNFDFKHNETALSLMEMVIERKPAPTGYRVDLNFGKTAEWVNAAEPSNFGALEHIQQAYLTFPTKLGGKAGTLDFGKFVTHHGAEVIEAKDNWNYTRSILFGWAIPYYHAGLRYRHPFDDTSGITLHVVNGWNNVKDNNDSLSYGVLYNTPLSKKLSLVQNYMGGPEQGGDNRNWRHLFDTILTYTASDKMAYMLNFDYLTEDSDDGSVSWKGIALYARRTLSDRHAVAIRGEWFSDDDGASTGTAQKVKEITLTYDIKGPRGLLTRAEARYDWSNKAVFDDRDGGQKDSQFTLLLGAIYGF